MKVKLSVAKKKSCYQEENGASHPRENHEVPPRVLAVYGPDGVEDGTYEEENATTKKAHVFYDYGLQVSAFLPKVFLFPAAKRTSNLHEKGDQKKIQI